MSTSSTPKTYKNLRTSIDRSEAVWVSPVDTSGKLSEEVSRELRGTLFILMGPTGSGKSTFIEAIASTSTRKPLGIAKDQLESVTQQPCLYEVQNLERVDFGYGKIYILDTPGFADPRISELVVFDQITKWRDLCQSEDKAIRLLCFHSITDIRMPASRKQCLDMVRHFWGLRLSERIMLVTSSWDRIPERSRNAAEKRFDQLSTSHWGDWIAEGSSVVKFENTFHSAVDILNTLCVETTARDKYREVLGLGMEGTTGNPVYAALLSRLTLLQQKRDMLLEDIARPESQSQGELISLLTNDLEKTELLLQRFKTEMEGFLKRFGPHNAMESSTTAELSMVHAHQGMLTLQSPLSATPSPDVARSVTFLPDIIDTISPRPDDRMFSPIVEVVEPQKVSVPKRFSQWAHKKIDKFRLGSSR